MSACSPKGEAVHRLPGGQLAFRGHDLGGFLLDDAFQIDGALVQFAAHGNTLLRALHHNQQNFGVHGPEQHVRSLQLEAFPRKVELVAVQGQDDFRIRGDGFPAFEQLQTGQVGQPPHPQWRWRCAGGRRSARPPPRNRPSTRHSRRCARVSPTWTRTCCSSSTSSMVSFMGLSSRRLQKRRA